MTDRRFPVVMRTGDTPVPIPNTTVKTGTADGTSLETARESRWPQDLKKGNKAEAFYIYKYIHKK